LATKIGKKSRKRISNTAQNIKDLHYLTQVRNSRASKAPFIRKKGV
jgi:hypothetical protein